MSEIFDTPNCGEKCFRPLKKIRVGYISLKCPPSPSRIKYKEKHMEGHNLSTSFLDFSFRLTLPAPNNGKRRMNAFDEFSRQIGSVQLDR